MNTLLQTDRRELSDFDAHFQTRMIPDLAQKEAGRKFRVRLGLCVAALLLVPSVWLAWYAVFQSDDPDTRAIVFPFVVPILGYFSIVWRLRLKSKQYIISHITSALGGGIGEARKLAISSRRLQIMTFCLAIRQER